MEDIVSNQKYHTKIRDNFQFQSNQRVSIQLLFCSAELCLFSALIEICVRWHSAREAKVFERYSLPDKSILQPDMKWVCKHWTTPCSLVEYRPIFALTFVWPLWHVNSERMTNITKMARKIFQIENNAGRLLFLLDINTKTPPRRIERWWNWRCFCIWNSVIAHNITFSKNISKGKTITHNTHTRKNS